jgi:thiol-disulfide isomerase/thioredoxin
MNEKGKILVLCGLTLLLISILYVKFEQKGNAVSPYGNLDLSGKVNAPEFEGGRGWLNVERPLSLRKDLKGKVVLVDFWTYCCINCLHILPDLKKLEQKYPEELVVVGVHSAKFLNEKDSENIRAAILRYEIEHPVINDADFQIWERYAANAWPSLYLIDPEGKIVGKLSGEGHYEVLDQAIQGLIEKFGNKINRQPIPIALERDREPETILSFPGKVYADGDSQRLFIADTNHNRIVITDFAGKILDIAGDSESGWQDGSFEEARFNHPQGMVLTGEQTLMVADTENHLLRVLDLKARSVKTVGGTGKQARWRAPGGAALQTALNSPWALTMRKDDPNVYIAMAGPHQLWVYQPEKENVEPFAGSGYENIVDGYLNEAQLAQPSGMTSDGTHIYFADSEVSALRMVDFTSKPKQVRTLIGKGLFKFGDQDGKFEEALLQHVLGVAYHEGRVYVADTYNHKIKAADLEKRTIQTIAGDGKPGIGTAEQPQFYEPSGLSIAQGKLYIADTNNNAIRVMDLKTNRVETLHIDNTSWLMQQKQPTFDLLGNPQPVVLQNEKVAPGGTVQIEFAFPQGYHFNPLAQPMVQLRAEGETEKPWISQKFIPEVNGDVIQFKLSDQVLQDKKSVDIGVTFFYCREDNQGECRIDSALFTLPIEKGGDKVTLQYSVEEKV